LWGKVRKPVMWEGPPTWRDEPSVRKSEGDRRQRLAIKEWGKHKEVRKLDEETSASGVSDK
jgi:hypothetical protein